MGLGGFRLALRLAGLAGIAGACAQPAPIVVGQDERVIVADVQPDEVRDIDLLFVVDDSPAMQRLAPAVGDVYAELVGSLEQLPGGLPSLHVGVVTTDLGAAGYPIAGCRGDGGGGRLQREARVAGCEPPDDHYLIDVPADDGTRTRNYAGTLTEALTCITPTGQVSCAFEQPLEAMRRALDGTVPENQGFLRTQALLAVVFVTDEDDCSASDADFFAAGPVTTEVLGRLDTFRCFRWGVTCDDDAGPGPGPRHGCTPREDSPYLFPVAPYVHFLRDLKGPGMTVVAAVTGAGGPVDVELDVTSGALTLATTCADHTLVRPAVRLNALLDWFPGRSRFSSLCEDSLAQPLVDTSLLVADSTVQRPCLLGSILDMDVDTPGIQPSCRVYDALLGGDEPSRTELPRCDSADGRPPCQNIAENADACGHTESRLALQVTRLDPRPAGTHLLVECLVP